MPSHRLLTLGPDNDPVWVPLHVQKVDESKPLHRLRDQSGIRGTPLWQAYVARGIIDDERDWHKWFKCLDIDLTTVPSALVNRLRAKGYGLLFRHRMLKRPIRTWKLLRAFSRHMTTSDLLKLLSSPFRRRTLTRRPDLPARMIDAGLEAPDRRTASATARPVPSRRLRHDERRSPGSHDCPARR